MFYRHYARSLQPKMFAFRSAIAVLSISLLSLSSPAVAALKQATSTLATSTLAASTQVASATTQPDCPGDNNIPTATTTRTATFADFGLQVTIPANFRTLLYNNGTIAIVHPVDFNLIQCLTLGLPVLGTDALNPESFRLIDNPTELTAQDYALGLEMSGFTISETISMQTENGLQVFIREAVEQEGLGVSFAYAWYQPAGRHGIIEISTATKAELLDVLSRTQRLESGLESALDRL
ncbi:MAG: hypothetical protein AAGC93_13295 [Cyanobacteria bacterium P01_F01_bin.53]